MKRDGNWHAKATGMKAKEREQRKRKMQRKGGKARGGGLIRSRMRGGERKRERSREREIFSLRVRQFKMDMLISHADSARASL